MQRYKNGTIESTIVGHADFQKFPKNRIAESMKIEHTDLITETHPYAARLHFNTLFTS